MAENPKTQRYYHYSEKASEIVRTIGFAGLGVVWIFHRDIEGKPFIPWMLGLAATLIVFSLMMDLLHYVCNTAYWAFQSSRPANAQDEERLSKVGLLTIVLLIMKFGTMLVAAGVLVIYLGTNIYVWSVRH